MAGQATVVLALTVCIGDTRPIAQAPGSPATPPPPQDARERWNKEYDSGIPTLLNADANQFLAATIKGRTAGSALDLGIGQGRNAVYLAKQGWTVTGVDISDVAVTQARANAARDGVAIATVVSDLDLFDFGTERWDLITLFYMHSWHKNSRTEVAERIVRSLKPGGLLVMEAFRRPPNINGLVAAELGMMYQRLRIVQNEEVVGDADWGTVPKTALIRFVAEKAR